MPKLDPCVVETSWRLGDCTYFVCQIVSGRRARTYWLGERLWQAYVPDPKDRAHWMCGVTRRRLTRAQYQVYENLCPRRARVGVYELTGKRWHARVGQHLLLPRLEEPAKPWSKNMIKSYLFQHFNVSMVYINMDPATVVLALGATLSVSQVRNTP